MLTLKILKTFAEGAQSRSRRPVVLLIPTGSDLLYAKRSGVWSDQRLADALRAEAVRVVHAGPKLMEKLGAADPCPIFEDCHGHFNSARQKRVAEIVAEEIKARD